MPKQLSDDRQLMTHLQEQALRECLQGGPDDRAANRALAQQALAWVIGHPIDDEEFLRFFDVGECAEHERQQPQPPPHRRMVPQAGQIPTLIHRLHTTPLDYQGAIELSYVYERIQQIIASIKHLPGQTMSVAIILYYTVGSLIHDHLVTETGQTPAAFAIPRGRMRGDANALT